jgi:hypothetical protein
MGTFTRRLPRVMVEQAIRNGVDPAMAEYVVEQYNLHRTDNELIPVEIAWMGGKPKDLAFANAATMFTYNDPAVLLPHIDYMFHIQAKFYEMVDDTEEYSIPYTEIIKTLADGGYKGYLSSEYEGQRLIEDAFPVDSVEQVRRQHAMFAAALDEIK